MNLEQREAFGARRIPARFHVSRANENWNTLCAGGLRTANSVGLRDDVTL
jgi:hypothetical protein